MGWGRSKGGKGGSKGGSNGKDDKDGDVVPQSGFFGGGGYASFGDYMVEKNRKLKEQFAAAAATSGETGKATIFRGLSFWMTGRTCLPDQELKRIIVEHGGVYEQYDFTHVTHIIADNLASGNQTWAELKKRSKRVNVVTSSWVTACVQEGRRLPEMRFMPKCLSSGSSMLSFLDQPDARKPTPAEGPEDADASVSSHRGDVDDVAQKQSLDLTCEETQPCSAEQVEEGEDPSAPAKKRRKSIVSVDSEHLLSQTPQRIQQNFATSALAFEVNTSCTEGLAGFNELLEVLSDLAAGAAQQLSEQGRCAAAVGLKITLGQRQAEWSGMAGTEGHGGQEVLLTTLTSLAHRAVAALGLSTGLTAETAHGKVHIDPDAGYRAVCHVGIQLHFQHGQASGRQEPALAKPSKPDRGGQDLTGPAGRETTCSSAANQPTVPLALRPEVAEMASTSCAGILSGPTVRPSTKHRSRWKVLPMWAPDVSAQQLMDHWRAICHRVQGLQKGSVSEWHKVCHPRAGHTPGVAASLDLHVYAFEDLLARKEFEVVHLALRALRAAVKSRVACTLRGDGQLPTPSHFNALLSAVQLSLAGDSGARFKVAPLALPETAEKSQTTVPCSGSDTAAEIVSSAHAKLRWGE